MLLEQGISTMKAAAFKSFLTLCFCILLGVIFSVQVTETVTSGIVLGSCKPAYKWCLCISRRRNLLSIKRCDSHGAPRSRHTGHVVPLPGLRVPAFHCVEIAPAVMAAHSVHGSLQDGNAFTNIPKEQCYSSRRSSRYI